MSFASKAYDAGIPCQQVFDYAGGTNVTYIGWADPGASQSAAKWRIQKLTYDGNNNVTAIQFAGGSIGFNQVWSNRTTLTYS